MALFPQLNEIRSKLARKSSLSAKESALLSELDVLNSLNEDRSIASASVRLTKMTGPDDGRCGCCGR
jgi:hypothetical protein